MKTEWIFAIRKLRNTIVEGAKAHIRRLAKKREVHIVELRPELRPTRVEAITPLFNEEIRIPYFLTYYRELSVDHFIFIDNLSIDGTRAFLLEQSDVSIFEARCRFSKARYAMDWVNHVLGTYCCGKWVLQIDADDMFVYPHHDITKLPLFAVTSMSMYSDRLVTENRYAVGQDPLEVCALYDDSVYESYYEPMTHVMGIKGGVKSLYRKHVSSTLFGHRRHKRPV